MSYNKEIYDLYMKSGMSDEVARLMAQFVAHRQKFNMGGVGYDIANSNNLTECEKEYLIRSCENYAYNGKDFSDLDKYLLWKVRKCYHIQQMGLSEIAEPASIIDRLLY